MKQRPESLKVAGSASSGNIGRVDSQFLMRYETSEFKRS